MSSEKETKQGRSLLDRFYQPVDGATLGLFRLCWGFLMALEAVSRFPKVVGVYSPDYFHFKYPLFTFVHEFPEHWMVFAEIFVLLLAGIGVFLGVLFRTSTVVFGLIYFHLFLVDSIYYNNHHYLTVLVSFLLAFTGADKSFSLRSWKERDPDGCAVPHTVPFWNYILLRGQIVILYFFGGIAKINGDWLRAEPLLYWFESSTTARFPLTLIIKQDWLAWMAAYGGLAIDLGAPFFLLWARTRPFMIGILVLFHLMNSRIFAIGFFPWIGIGMCLIFLKPSTARLGWGRFQKTVAGVRRIRMPDLRKAEKNQTRSRLALAGVCAFLAWQVLFPLRPYVFDGNPAWTEVGHKFSWRMMLRNKDAYIQYLFSNPEVEPWLEKNPDKRPNIAPEHVDRMTKHPWMMIQYARELDRILAENGMPDTEIRVLSVVSLNDRPYQVMVDPTADLTEVEYPLWGIPDYIVPLDPDAWQEKRPLAEQDRLLAIQKALTEYAESHPESAEYVELANVVTPPPPEPVRGGLAPTGKVILKDE